MDVGNKRRSKRGTLVGVPAATDTTVMERIAAGAYESTVPYVRGSSDEARSARLARMADESELRARFRADALRELGLEGHPKGDRLFDIAWSQGHAAGLHEVLGHMEELADLLR